MTEFLFTMTQTYYKMKLILKRIANIFFKL